MHEADIPACAIEDRTELALKIAGAAYNRHVARRRILDALGSHLVRTCLKQGHKAASAADDVSEAIFAIITATPSFSGIRASEPYYPGSNKQTAIDAPRLPWLSLIGPEKIR